MSISLNDLNAQQPAPEGGDPYKWLEDVGGERQLAWAKERNAETMQELGGSPAFEGLKEDLLKILDSRERIPYVSKRGGYYYNFWIDDKNPRGLWRRTTLEEYRKPEPKWEVLLDLDALGKAEGENWVWHGSQALKAGGYRHCLLSLSRGGADAEVVREFDIEKREFVKDGFNLPEAKGGAAWIDKDHVFVQTDFGPGTMTDSGYPRQAKLWRRGTPLAEAKLVYEGKQADMSVGAYHDATKGYERDFVYRTIAFYKNEQFLRAPDGTLRKVEVPDDASASVFRDWLLVELRSPWAVGGSTYPAGALLAGSFEGFMAGRREFAMLYQPAANTSLAGYNWTRRHLILNVVEDVKNRLEVLTPGAGWKREPLEGAAPFSSVSAWGIDPEETDEYMMDIDGFLNPASLHYGLIGGRPERLKQQPAFFEAKDLEVAQYFAVSRDGTKVPYFLVSPKNMKLDGDTPTLLYGYGGFEVPMYPGYSGMRGRAWLGRGGAFALANIRGGSEYGPRWHQAALKSERHRAYEDFAAVASDLAARGVAKPARLGAMGGSNGGLLTGNMLTLYPQLFGAIVSQVPLLDMKNYSHLLAGASWVAEYGDPDKPEEWEYIKTFSPYHNLKKGGAYPPVLFTTSTRDDRVHPAHARKMTAKMKDLGLDVRYYENIEGGHGGAADNKQRAHMLALEYTFLWNKLTAGK
ncbi:MAG: prolyl oligopeptidase family protein [Elusimicrobiales bacterium]